MPFYRPFLETVVPPNALWFARLITLGEWLVGISLVLGLLTRVGAIGRPFLVLDCGALCPELIESELFGHEKGAFTGADRQREGKLASAGAGTVLLDEVNSLPPHLQAKLLRVVEERLFDRRRDLFSRRNGDGLGGARGLDCG